MISKKSKQVKWKIEFVSFKCRHCSAPFQLPQELVNHKKKHHAREVERYSTVRRQRERIDRNRSLADVRSSSSRSQNSASAQFRHVQGSLRHTSAPSQVKQEPGWFYGNTEHCCRICNIQCTSESSLKDHHQQQHSLGPELAFPCSWCDSSFADAGPRQNHILLHENRMKDGTDFPCGLCDKRYLSAYAAGNHRRNDHEATSPLLSAEKVARKPDTPTQQDVNKVIKKTKIGNITRYSCVECNKSFRQRSIAIDHAYIHMKKQGHQCGLCNEEFSTQSAKAIHMDECHSGQFAKIKTEQVSPQKRNTRITRRGNKCKQPNYIEDSDASKDESERSAPSLSGPFARALLPPKRIKIEEISPRSKDKQAGNLPSAEDDLSQHEICQICEQCLDSRTNVLSHYKQHAHQHKSGSDFPCKMCPCRFLNLPQLDFHVGEKHPLDIDQIEDAPYSSQNGQIINDDAPNEDIELSDEQLAMLTRPAECQECGIEFETSYDLIDHKKGPDCMDRGKSYIQISACHICDFVSIRRTDLLRHIQVHRFREEKNSDFPCSDCPKRFLKKSLLNNHVQARHDATQSPLDDFGNEEYLSEPNIEDCRSNGNGSVECSLTSADSEDVEESLSDEEGNQREVRLKNRNPINLEGDTTGTFPASDEGQNIVGFFFCDVCDYRCIWQGKFEKHQAEHKAAEIDFPCPYCPKRFLEPSDIQAHAKKCTGNLGANAKSNSSTSATDKVTDVLVKPKYRTRCRPCNASFLTMLELYQHKMSTCPSLRSNKTELEYFECQLCDFICIWKALRRKHNLQHNDPQEAKVVQPLENSEKATQEVVAEDNECPRICSNRPIVFSSSNHSLQHKTSSLNEDNELSRVCDFRCEECGYTCIWKSERDKHRLLHQARNLDETEPSCQNSAIRFPAEKVGINEEQAQQQPLKAFTLGDLDAHSEVPEKRSANTTDSNSNISTNKYFLPPAFKANTMRYQEPVKPSLFRDVSAKISSAFDQDLGESEPLCSTKFVSQKQTEDEDPIDISKLEGPHDVPDVPHTCHTCKTSFINIVRLVKHRRAAHPSNIDYDYGVFPCTFCDDLIPWKVGWRNHVQTHRQLMARNRDYPCPACSKRFVLMENRDAHMCRYHSDIDNPDTSLMRDPMQMYNSGSHEDCSSSAQTASKSTDVEATSEFPSSKKTVHVMRGVKIPFRKSGSVAARGTGWNTKPNALRTPVKVVRGFKISLRHLSRGKSNPSLKSVNSAKNLLHRSRLEMPPPLHTTSAASSPVPIEVEVDRSIRFRNVGGEESLGSPYCVICRTSFISQASLSIHISKNHLQHANGPELRVVPIETTAKRTFENINSEPKDMDNNVLEDGRPSAEANDVENLTVEIDPQLPAEHMSFESQSISTTAYTCSCGKNFMDFEALKLHAEQDHKEESTEPGLKDATVEKDQKNQQKSVANNQTQEETEYNLVCESCGDIFRDELLLDTHLRHHQTAKDGNTDQECPKQFQKHEFLEMHTMQCRSESTVIDNNQFLQACADLSRENKNGQVPVLTPKDQDHRSTQKTVSHRSPRKTRSMKTNENEESHVLCCAKCEKSFRTLPEYFEHRKLCYNHLNAVVNSNHDTQNYVDSLEDQDIKVPIQDFTCEQQQTGFKRPIDVITVPDEDMYSRVKSRRRSAVDRTTPNAHEPSSPKSSNSN